MTGVRRAAYHLVKALAPVKEQILAQAQQVQLRTRRRSRWNVLRFGSRCQKHRSLSDRRRHQPRGEEEERRRRRGGGRGGGGGGRRRRRKRRKRRKRRRRRRRRRRRE